MSEKHNLLDMMAPEDREKALRAYRDRMAGGTEHRRESVSEIAFMIAEAGVFFGWSAVEAIKRGYVEAREEPSKEHPEGKIIQIPLTMEEVSELCRAARKIKYSDTVNASRGNQVAFGSVLSKNPGETFKKGMKPFVNEVKEK